MTKDFFKQKVMIGIVVVFFSIFTIWWLFLSPLSIDSSLDHKRFIWGSCYQLIAILGGLFGLFVAKSFGWLKSFFGRSITFFSIGLLLQSFGQSVYSYYNLIANVQAPYPSLGDVGFFGSVIFYILGIIYLSKILEAHLSQKLQYKIQVVIVPIFVLIGAYLIFLKDYEFDWTDKLKTFLDFGYPLGQAFYVSLAVSALLISTKVLGGIFKKPITLFLLALIMQYLSDFYFLVQANAGNWYVGGIGDFLYMLSYLIMTLSIIEVSRATEVVPVNKV